MEFALSEERQMLADTVGRFVADRYDIAARHANAKLDGGFNRATWADMAELGLVSALLPPEVGGFGGLGEDIAVIFEALGRGLVVEPFLASGVLGASPLMLEGTDAHKALLEDVAAGKVILALAHGEPESRYSLSQVKTQANKEGDTWRLNGRKAVVLNGDTADRLVVSARTEGAENDQDGIALFLIDANAVGVTRRGYATIDGGRAAEISLANVAAKADAVIGTPGQAFAMIEQTHARGIVALCAEAIGAMDVAKDTTLEYLKTRRQFGRPIGTFQALQHRMVDMLIEIEQARSAVMLAAGTLEAGRTDRERNCAAAKNLIGRVGRQVAEECIQMHGGIAMTWEYSLPHYAKRLTMIDHQLGDTDFHLERFQQFANEAA